MALDLGMDGAGGENKPEATRVEGHASSIDPSPTHNDAPAGRPEYVPEKFWRAAQDDPTKGEVNAEAWGTAWKDTEATLTRTQQELADLRKQSDLPSAPKDAADYMTGFDLAALAKAAPKILPGDDEATAREAGAKEWFALAHKRGLSVDQARGFFADYMALLNDKMDDPVDPKVEMEERVKALGTEGAVIQEKVQNALDTMHGERAFSDEQQATLRSIVRQPGGLGFLYRVLETRGSIAPPTIDRPSGDRMTAFQIREAMQTARYRQDDEYRKRIMDAHAALEQATQRDQPATHRSLRLG